MRVFISWSGPQSKAIATALSSWLPDVIQSIEVWMSEHDIAAGSKWSEQISDVLENSNFGVICLTPDNQDAPWLLFEAGCLAKTGKIARVIPYLYGLSATDVRFPLAQFQSVDATKEGTLKLVQSLVASNEVNVPIERLEKVFLKWWPDLKENIEKVDVNSVGKFNERTDRELLEEVLGLVRNNAKPTHAVGRRNNVNVTKKGKSGYLNIDLSDYLGEPNRNVSVRYDPRDSISDFLDRVYFAICETHEIPAYKYGSAWLLKDLSTGKLFDDIGIEYSQSGGEIRELKPIVTSGILEESELIVVKPRYTRLE